MADNQQDYFETDSEREEGHVDTNPDKHLGCDLGIDVQGQKEV